MRIVHVSHELPPYETAGTAIYTLNIARAQAVKHEVSIFARLQDPKIEAYRVHDEARDGLNIRFFNRADLDWSPLEASYVDPRAAELFGRFLDETRPQIVHFQHIVGLGLDVLDLPRSRGIKTVYTLHDFWPMCPMGQRMCYTDYQICDPIDFRKCGPCVFGAGWKDPDPEADGRVRSGPRTVEDVFHDAYRERYTSTPGRFARKPRAMLWAARHALRALRASPAATDTLAAPTSNPFVTRVQRMQAAMRHIDLIITPSAFLRDEFVTKFNIPEHQIIHSANGMDFSYVEALPKPPSPRLRFGFMGSIIKTKGVHVLVDAFLKAVAGRVDLELHVFGAPNRWSGDYEAELKAKAAHCPYVNFHGRYKHTDVSTVLQAFDVLVLPSIWFENAPLTLNEAAMSGTPILVSDRGGMLEFVRANGFGRTFKLGDADDLARHMVELANDRKLVPSLAGNPPRIKPVADNAEELLGIYERILAGTWKPPARSTSPRADTRIEHA